MNQWATPSTIISVVGILVGAYYYADKKRADAIKELRGDYEECRRDRASLRQTAEEQKQEIFDLRGRVLRLERR